MIPFIRWVSFLSVFLIYNCTAGTAQQLSCDKLQQIIQVAAADSTFQSLKGAEKISANGKIKEYAPLVTLWATSDLHRSQYISYNSYSQHITYDAYVDYEGSEALAKEGATELTNVDEGYATAGKKNTTIEFQNLFNKTKTIKLSLNDAGVEMEMH